MKISAIITIISGIFLIVLAVGLFQSLPTAKADDIVFYVFGMIFSGFGGFAFICAGIEDYNKHSN